MRVLSVVGNRPQFIKSAPLSAALRDAGIDEVVLHTGQHYDPELSQVFFDELGLGEPRYRLDVRDSDPERMLPGIRSAVEQERPDWVLVYGDTNSTLAGARAAGATPVAHVEAGLRSFDLSMPEERNRIAVDRISALLFCPDERSAAQLAAEGVTGPRRGRRRRDGRREPPLRADRARALADPRAARRRAGPLRARDGPPRGERAAGAPRAGSSTGSTGSTSRSSSPRTRARAPRSTAIRAPLRRRSTRSATSTSPRSPRRRA